MKHPKKITVSVRSLTESFYRAGLHFTNKPQQIEVTEKTLTQLQEEKNLILSFCTKACCAQTITKGKKRKQPKRKKNDKSTLKKERS